MYANLKTEMALKNINMEDIANELNLHRNSVSNKLKGGKFSIEEAMTIQKTFFPYADLQYLFKNDKRRNEPDKKS